MFGNKKNETAAPSSTIGAEAVQQHEVAVPDGVTPVVAPATGTQDAKAPDRGTSTSGADASPADRKGRPTPTRKEAEAKNRRPLVASAGDPKAARAEQRKANAEARARMNEAMNTGDERYMPVQHKGVQRRYIRDYVDARWSLGEFFLPIALVFVVLTFVVGQNPNVALPLLLAMYLLVIIAVVDSVLAGLRIRKRLRTKFGEDKVQKGGVMYAVLRSFQMRPTRQPKPQVKRGEFPA